MASRSNIYTALIKLIVGKQGTRRNNQRVLEIMPRGVSADNIALSSGAL